MGFSGVRDVELLDNEVGKWVTNELEFGKGFVWKLSLDGNRGFQIFFEIFCGFELACGMI